MAKKTGVITTIHEDNNNNQEKQQHNTNCLKIKIDHLKTFQPLTENQRKFFEAYEKGDCFIGLLGSAGSGKSFVAMYKAIEEALDKGNPFTQVVIVRSAVQVREQGFVPGSLEEKMSMYELPYVGICETLFGRSDAWTRLKEQKKISFLSTTAIRGISIENAVVIVDEATNCSWQELAAVISRVGNCSKIIFVGDLNQNDLIKSKYDVSGLAKFLSVARTMDEFTEITFTSNDIIRSKLVKSWIIACEKCDV